MKLNNQEVIVLEVDGVDTRDYPDFVDAYISSAYFSSSGQSLTDEELEELNEEFSNEIQQLALESIF